MNRKGPEFVREELASHMIRLWRYGLVLTGKRDAAEDLAQATCLRALERAHQFQPGTQLDHWLFAILRSIWLNEIRARLVRENHRSPEDASDMSAGERNDIETNVLARQVLRKIEGLPLPQRETILLVCAEGFTYREAAQLLDVPIGTIMSRLATARAALVHLSTEEPANLSPEANER